LREYFDLIKTKKTAFMVILTAASSIYWASKNSDIQHFKILFPIVIGFFFGLSFLIVDFLEKAYDNIESINKYLKPKHFSSREKTENRKAPSLIPRSSAVLFSDRFSLAFPGVREISWYSGNDAVKRLSILLQEPLTFSLDDSQTQPIWWWRGGNLQISNFEKLSRDTVLINNLELQINKIAAVRGSDYYRSFVYLEAMPMEQSGASKISEADISEQIKDNGFAREDYGIYKKKPIPISHFEDGATVRRGKVINIANNSERRCRFLTKYNLVIAPHKSPINNGQFDDKLEEILNSMLEGKSAIEDLESAVESLPKLPHYVT